MFAAQVNAIELFRTIPLPDDGRGSTARAAMLGATNDTFKQVVGSKMNGSGMSVPMVWSVNLMTNTAVGTELPLPMGTQGEALGGATFPATSTDGGVTFNNDRVVVGNIFDRGTQWGVIWRKPANGMWSMPEPLCQDAEQSWAARADYCGDGSGLLAVAGSAFEGGRWLAVLHYVSATDVVTVDLPAPPGSNGAALGLDCDMGGTWVGGWITDRQGRMRPVVWANTGQGYATFPTSLQSGAQGRVNAILALGSKWLIAGDVIRAGRTVGFATEIYAASADPITLLQPLNGYANSLAENFFRLGATIQDDDDTPTLSLGTSTNPGGPPVATVWLDGSPFPAQQLMHDGNTLTRNEAFHLEPGASMAVGSFVDAPGGQLLACVFPATNTHVPDRLDLLGNRAGGSADNLVALWHDDNSALRIRAEHSGGMLKAVVDLQFTPLAGPNMPSSIQYNLIARAEGNQPGASGTLNVYAFNFMSQTWVPAGSFQLGLIYSGESGGLNALGFLNPQSGAVRLRLEFIANGNRPTALVCDTVRLSLQ